MNAVAILLGSNSNQQSNIFAAIELIQNQFRITKKSAIYQSPCINDSQLPPYWNMGAVIETQLTPEEIKHEMNQIERALKKVKQDGLCNIDIDIIFYTDRVVPNLKIPHPHSLTMQYVITPLAEIIPEFIHPNINQKLMTLFKPSRSIIKVTTLESLHAKS